MVAYSRSSPYSATEYSNGYLDILNLIELPAHVDDVQFMITGKYTHRPDLLAYDLYNDSGLWWVFAVRNKEVIKDSIYDLISGQVLFIPKITTIKKAIGSI